MAVDPATSRHRHDYRDHTYYFCSAGCRGKFAAAPEKYLKPGVAPEPAMAEVTIYTCPMHPEVRQVGPGACPICGMALEPVTVTAEAPDNPELLDMTRRFWIGLILTLPVTVLEMGGHLVDLGVWLTPNVDNVIQLALATPVVLWAGWPFFVRGWHSFVTRNLNMFSLIAVGTGVAWAYSVVATLAPQLFPRLFAATKGRSAFISRRRRESRCWCCSAKCWSCAPGSAPPARSARSSISHRKLRAGSRPTVPRLKSRLTSSLSETVCGCGRERRSRSTAA